MTLEAKLNIMNYTATLINCDILIDSKSFRILEDKTITATGSLLNVQKPSDAVVEFRRFSTSVSLMKKMDFQCGIQLASCIPSIDPRGRYYTGHQIGNPLNL